LKKLFDFCVALSILILASPLLILVSTLVYIFLGRPILFLQVRPGFHAIPFTIYKFRTMLNVSTTKMHSLCDEDRLTTFGRLLRRTSLDELPQLFNVLKGDLSLVGPRPLLMEYLPLYSAEQTRRHDVYPGITGWAQVNGRNSISWEGKFKMDVWYVNNQSFLLDIKILGLTIWKVFKREGVTQKDHPTAEKFHGSTR